MNRRTFLRVLGGVTAATALAPLLPDPPLFEPKYYEASVFVEDIEVSQGGNVAALLAADFQAALQRMRDLWDIDLFTANRESGLVFDGEFAA